MLYCWVLSPRQALIMGLGLERTPSYIYPHPTACMSIVAAAGATSIAFWKNLLWLDCPMDMVCSGTLFCMHFCDTKKASLYMVCMGDCMFETHCSILLWWLFAVNTLCGHTEHWKTLKSKHPMSHTSQHYFMFPFSCLINKGEESRVLKISTINWRNMLLCSTYLLPYIYFV